jgi:hypothetical protein
VGQYLDFMYQKALPTHHFSHLDFIYIGLARLYVFGERFLDSFIRNNVVQQLISYTTIVNRNEPSHPIHPRPAAIEIIYEGTTAASPFRRLLVGMYARHGSKEWLAPEDLHPSFCLDVARALMAQANDNIPENCRGYAIRTTDYFIAG